MTLKANRCSWLNKNAFDLKAIIKLKTFKPIPRSKILLDGFLPAGYFLA
jgi:hypothetical protein